MATVWVVMSGELSRGRLAFEGVFSAERLAREYIAKHEHTGDFHDPEEYEVDAMASWEWGPLWSAAIRVESGEWSYPARETGHQVRHPTKAIVRRSADRCPAWIKVDSPISAAHAEAVAIEERRKALREAAVTPAKGPS